MEEFAKLLTAIAALLGAVALPATLLIVLYLFRGELRLALIRFPTMLDRVKKASVAGVVLELDRVANAEAVNDLDKGGKITPRQFEAASRIQSQEVDITALLAEMDRLCLEYDSLRRMLPSGENRTRAMTRVIVKMRSLAPSVVDFLETYKGSGSPGSRLAAIAIMQMDPRVADVDWLKERFSSEHPFIFYHAALALQNVANVAGTLEEKKRLLEVAQQALATIKSFGSNADRGTIEVLKMLIASLPQPQTL